MTGYFILGFSTLPWPCEGHRRVNRWAHSYSRSSRGRGPVVAKCSISDGDAILRSAEAIADRVAGSHVSQRSVVGLAGTPGSGKTTIVSALVDVLKSKGLRTCALPMDGFHFYRSQLDGFSDPEEAHRRRGAPFTFDAERFVEVIARLRTPGLDVRAPDFDHRNKDPEEDAIVIAADTQVVVVEGNYLLLEQHPWSDIAPLLDLSFYLDVDVDTAMTRVAARHVDQMGLSIGEAWVRVDSNDRPNAKLINSTKHRADFLVRENRLFATAQTASDSF